MNTITYIGVIDGLHTWEVRNDAGEVVGMNQCPYPPCPGDGWVLDEDTATWVQNTQENHDANV
jgi:hypothetical protein